MDQIQGVPSTLRVRDEISAVDVSIVRFVVCDEYCDFRESFRTQIYPCYIRKC